MSPKITDEQKEQRRKEILHAAKRVFSEKGYEPATLKDIVEAAGMSRGWIYLYFQTKEEIFEALLEQHDQEYERYIGALLASRPSVWEVILETFAQTRSELVKTSGPSIVPSFYEYFLTGWRNEQRRSYLLKRYENGIGRFAKLLSLGIERGEFSPVIPPEEISRIAASFQEGIMSHTIAVGFELAHTELQLDALVQYLQQLVRPRHMMDRTEFN